MGHTSSGGIGLEWLEVLPFSQYKVRVDGTGRVTRRNRVFLQRIIPYVADVDMQPGDRMHMRMDRGVYQPGVGDTQVTGGDGAEGEPAVGETGDAAGSLEVPVQEVTEVPPVRRSSRVQRQRVMFGSG